MSIHLAPEERYLLDFDTRDLPRYTTDVLVVGGGVAGLSAALAAAREARVLLLMKDEVRESNTWHAQGGIAAAISDLDSVDAHVEDTLRTGCGLCDTRVVEEVVRAGPEAVRALAKLGTRFDEEEAGGYALGREGGHSQRRILHARGDATGAECSQRLIEAVRTTDRIHLHAPVFSLDLLTAEGRCVGVLARRAGGELFAVFARAVVLAAGGAGRLFRETSNVRGATGDGIAAAFRAGALLGDLEFVQFHPTTLYLAGSNRELVTEAVRGEGAHLVDNHGERFLAGVHPAGELAPRDIVSRAILEHLARPGITGVFLDLRAWPTGQAARRFPGLARTCARYGLDPEREPIPVRPAAHYFLGGILTDLDGRTNLPGLFACGEAACSGLHGANRLASNSLLEGLVLGPRAGRAAAAEREERFDGDLVHAAGRESVANDVDIADLRRSLVSRMWRSAGMLREASGLEETSEEIARWRRFSSTLPLFTRGALELENMLLLGALVAGSAALREESRGTHARRDFPDRDDDRFRGHFLWRAGERPRYRPREEAALTASQNGPRDPAGGRRG